MLVIRKATPDDIPTILRMVKDLAAYERETGQQIAVLTVPTLAGEAIEAFSMRVPSCMRSATLTASAPPAQAGAALGRSGAGVRRGAAPQKARSSTCRASA